MRPLKPSHKIIRLNGTYPYERVAPQRPIVVRKGNRVVKCHLYANTKECLGTRCFWPRVGTCPTFTRIDATMRKKNGNGKNGKKYRKNGKNGKNGKNKYNGNGWVKNGVWKGK